MNGSIRRNERPEPDMDRLNIGLVHPGEMGAAVGGALAGQGRTVLWASAGRGPATADLADAGTVAELAARAGIILSICPPHAAREVAGQVARAGFGGVFVDANAVSPETAREVAGIVGAGGAAFVDGGIIGLPPGQESGAGGPRLYLSGESGERAAEVRDLFAGTVVDARVVEGGAGAASAVKMAYAAWTKGTAALLLAARALAQAEHVADPLLAEWELSQPGLAGRAERAARSATAKGWRWEAEMTEIAASMTAAGLPGGFHQAAAEVFRRSPRAEGASSGEPGEPGDGAALDRVLGALIGRQTGRPAGQQDGSRSDR